MSKDRRSSTPVNPSHYYSSTDYAQLLSMARLADRLEDALPSQISDLDRRIKKVFRGIKDWEMKVNATNTRGAKSDVVKVEENENEDELELEEDENELEDDENELEEDENETEEEEEDEHYQLESTASPSPSPNSSSSSSSSTRPTSQRKYTDAEKKHYIQRLDKLRRNDPYLSVSDAAIQCGIPPSIARKLIRSRARRLLQILEVPSDRGGGRRQRLGVPYSVEERPPQQKSTRRAKCSKCSCCGADH